MPGAITVWTVTFELKIGHEFTNGTGTLLIQPGGRVDAQTTRLARGALLRLEGGTLATSEILFVAVSAQFAWVAGTLRVGRYNGNLTVPSGGVLAPLLEPSGATITGDYNQQTAGTTLAVDISGPFQFTDYGVLTTQGTTALGGTLQLNLIDGFAPTALNSFDILRANGGLTGAFANVANGQRLSTSDGLGSFIVNYGPGSPFNSSQVVLSGFITGIPGDFDVDGNVDGNDFLIWQRGDSPNHGNAADLVAWRVNFGAAAASGAVPEPSGEWIALAATGLACAVRRGSGAVLAQSHRLKN
jgi:hypothetical protein